jgi:alkylation response protein AidB-like acyl-CoA dehydrogenase
MWHPFMHAVVLVAVPIFYGAYLGVAEKAREIALGLAMKRKHDPLVAMVAGEMENEIVAAQITHADMIALTSSGTPGPAATTAMMCRRTILVKAVTQAASKAMELAGGAGFYRSSGLERCFRDIQAARYHPIPEKPQTQLAGRFLLGLDFDA